ncbi:uncharacterized protein LOC132645251 [Lycium barbarum]|uniref:uncharacterized protein LOC132645251 n=1 Tax=Lycium barbarum TaxID=112863 RepID=UPI00293EB6DA|nr:uncharacterized protein LOC132645251 [Lycium barbarum]
MIPACFSIPHSEVSKTSSSPPSQVPQNLVTCIYQAHICGSPVYLTLTWSRNMYSHSLLVHAPDLFSITIPLHQSSFAIFKARHGSKSIHPIQHDHKKMKIHWDFTVAKFNQNSAEPEGCFYIAITCNARLEFFLGDMLTELTGRARLVSGCCSGDLTLLSRREHVFGRRSYTTRARIRGVKHEFVIECGGGVLKVKVDGKTSLVVKRLGWKFRGNERILVGQVEVTFFWDVFNWVNKKCDNDKFSQGHGVFVFQVGDGGVWPEMGGAEKKLMRKSLSAMDGPTSASPSVSLLSSPSCSSVLQWAEESSECGRSSWSSMRSSEISEGFSLLLYAWRKD